MSADKIKKSAWLSKLSTAELKLLYSLKQKKYRRKHGLFLVEGSHPFEAAIRSGWRIEKVVLKESVQHSVKLPRDFSAKIFHLPEREFDRLADSQTPQGILAVVRTEESFAPNVKAVAKMARVVVADGISDPGNLGTMIRTAAAFAYDLFVCLNDCVDIYNPKVVRATQGGLFSIPIWEASSAADFIKLFAQDFKTIAFCVDSPTFLSQIPKANKMALVFGNEIRGISPELKSAASYRAKIDQGNTVESLNVAVAAGIGMWWGKK